MAINDKIRNFALDTKNGDFEQKLNQFLEKYIKESLKGTRFADEIKMYELAEKEITQNVESQKKQIQKEITFFGPEPITLNFDPDKINEKEFNEVEIKEIELSNDGTFAEVIDKNIPIGRYKVTSQILNDINVALYKYYKERNAQEYIVSTNTDDIVKTLEYSKMKIYTKSGYSPVDFEQKQNYDMAEISKLANIQTTYQMISTFPDLPPEIKINLIRENKALYERMIIENLENRFGTLEVEVDGRIENVNYIDLIIAEHPELLEEYPALQYEYNSNGLRKDFDEIIKARDELYLKKVTDQRLKKENREQLKSEVNKSFSRILYRNLMTNHSKEDIRNIIESIGVERFQEELKNINNDLNSKVREHEKIENEAMKYFEENRDTIIEGLDSDETSDVDKYFAMVNGQIALNNVEYRENLEEQEMARQELFKEIEGYVNEIKQENIDNPKEPLSEEEIEKKRQERNKLKLIGITGLVGTLAKKIYDKVKENSEKEDPESEEEPENPEEEEPEYKEEPEPEEEEPIHEEDPEKEVKKEKDKKVIKEKEIEEEPEPEEEEPIREEDPEKEVKKEKDKKVIKEKEIEKEPEPEEEKPNHEEDPVTKEEEPENDVIVDVNENKNATDNKDKEVDENQTQVEKEEKTIEEDEPVVTPDSEDSESNKETSNEEKTKEEAEDIRDIKINIKNINISVDNTEIKSLKYEKKRVQKELDEVKDEIHRVSTKSEGTRKYLVSIWERNKKDKMVESAKKQLIGKNEELEKEYEEMINSGNIDLEDPIIQKSLKYYEENVKFSKDMADRDQRKKLSKFLEKKKELLKEYFGIVDKIKEVEDAGIPQKLSVIEIEISEKGKNSPKKPGEDDGFEI